VGGRCGVWREKSCCFLDRREMEVSCRESSVDIHSKRQWMKKTTQPDQQFLCNDSWDPDEIMQPWSKVRKQVSSVIQITQVVYFISKKYMTRYKLHKLPD
jgi:hypothetical protein